MGKVNQFGFCKWKQEWSNLRSFIYLRLVH